jgi:hypothetical protein
VLGVFLAFIGLLVVLGGLAWMLLAHPSNPGPAWLTATGLAMVIVGAPFAIVGDMNRYATEYRAFMPECLKEHKPYECDIVWKAAQR